MIRSAALDALPVRECLPALVSALEERGAAVLCAPPGTGKTTLVPLVLAGLVGAARSAGCWWPSPGGSPPGPPRGGWRGCWASSRAPRWASPCAGSGSWGPRPAWRWSPPVSCSSGSSGTRSWPGWTWWCWTSATSGTWTPTPPPPSSSTCARPCARSCGWWRPRRPRTRRAGPGCSAARTGSRRRWSRPRASRTRWRRCGRRRPGRCGPRTGCGWTRRSWRTWRRWSAGPWRNVPATCCASCPAWASWPGSPGSWARWTRRCSRCTAGRPPPSRTRR